MNILVTDPGYKHSLTIIRNIADEKHNIFIIETSTKTLCSCSKYVSNIIRLNMHSAKYESDLLNAIEENNIELVIPVSAASYELFTKLKNKFKRFPKIVAIDYELYKKVLSKEYIYKLAESLNIPSPHTRYPESLDDINQIAQEIKYPCVIKAKYEMGINIVDYANTAQDLTLKYQNLCYKHNWQQKEDLPLIQDYITGFGCGFFAIYDRGMCGTTFQHKRIREFPPSGGYSTAAESFFDIKLQKYGKKLLDHLQWHGVAMVEFKMTSTGPVLLELNPKFWGSLDLACYCHANFPKEIVKIARGDRIFYSESYDQGVRCHWPFHGDIAHIIKNPLNIIPFIWDCISPRVKSNIWLRKDIFPTLFLIKNYILRRK